MIDKHIQWRQEAMDEINNFNLDPLFMLGVGLYWGEGSKYPNAFELTNSDIGVLKNWINWLKKNTPDTNLRYTIFAHNDVNKDEAIKYWSNNLHINDIIKYYLAVPKNSKLTRAGKLPYGTFRIAAKKGATKLLFKMKIWLELLSTTPLTIVS